MIWKHLKRLAVCMALVVAAGFILLVSLSDEPNYSAYGARADLLPCTNLRPGLSKVKSHDANAGYRDSMTGEDHITDLRVAGSDALHSRSHRGIWIRRSEARCAASSAL
jgi:hypothetical protein